MKPVKTLGLVVLAASVAMAFAVTGSATAETTAFCEFDTANLPNPGVCPEGHRVTHIHEATLSGAKAKILLAGVNLQCDVLFLGSTITPLRSPLLVTGAFTYTNCTAGCTVAEENGPSIREILLEEPEEADLLMDLLINVNCAAFNCSYAAEGMEGSDAGPLSSVEENGEAFFAGATLPKENGMLCPAQAFLDITTTSLTPLYIAK